MSRAVLTVTLTPPPVDKRAVLRYAGVGASRAELEAMLESCLLELDGRLRYDVCYVTLPLSVSDSVCKIGNAEIISHALSDCLRGYTRAVVFCATVGVEVDRLIMKYGRSAPSRALMLEAIGSERVEATCDAFCAALSKEHGEVSTRFSPGYADLPLDAQRDVFALLEPHRRVGVTLTSSLLMTPSKSVTAIVGVR